MERLRREGGEVEEGGWRGGGGRVERLRREGGEVEEGGWRG